MKKIMIIAVCAILGQCVFWSQVCDARNSAVTGTVTLTSPEYGEGDSKDDKGSGSRRLRNYGIFAVARRALGNQNGNDSDDDGSGGGGSGNAPAPSGDSPAGGDTGPGTFSTTLSIPPDSAGAAPPADMIPVTKCEKTIEEESRKAHQAGEEDGATRDGVISFLKDMESKKADNKKVEKDKKKRPEEKMTNAEKAYQDMAKSGSVSISVCRDLLQEKGQAAYDKGMTDGAKKVLKKHPEILKNLRKNAKKKNRKDIQTMKSDGEIPKKMESMRDNAPPDGNLNDIPGAVPTA